VVKRKNVKPGGSRGGGVHRESMKYRGAKTEEGNGETEILEFDERSRKRNVSGKIDETIR